MKKKLFVTAALCLLFAGCTPDTGGRDEPVGGDWRTWRGYTQPYTLTEPEDIVFSRYTPDEEHPYSYGYAAYDNEYGSRIGALNLPAMEGYEPANEADPTIINKDLDQDGCYEFGLSYNDGRVLWYGWSQDLLFEMDVFTSNPFVIIGTGDTEGILEEYDYNDHYSHRMYRITDESAVNATVQPLNEDGSFSVEIYDHSSYEYIGSLNVSGEMGMDYNGLDTQYGIFLISDYHDGDYYDLGIPFSDGQILWYSYHPDNGADDAFVFEKAVMVEQKDLCLLDEYTEIQGLFSDSEDRLAIDIYDVNEEDLCYGTIYFNDPEISANDVLCENGYDPALITKDLDGDGIWEVGVRMLDESVYWTQFYEGEFLDIGKGDSNGPSTGSTESLFDTLMSVVAEQVEGMTIIQSQDIEIDGILCEQYIAGTDHEDHFTAEYHYAVSPDGTVYILDVLNGNEYRPINR